MHTLVGAFRFPEEKILAIEILTKENLLEKAL